MMMLYLATEAAIYHSITLQLRDRVCPYLKLRDAILAIKALTRSRPLIIDNYRMNDTGKNHELVSPKINKF